jgi:hypothetical protein
MMNMNSSLIGYIYPFVNMMAEMKERNEEWKERILKQWVDSRNLPRKKKKQLRKKLQLEWNIANWEPDFMKW